MNKLQQYRDDRIQHRTRDYKFAYKQGFDTAIQLNLAVEFAEWKDKNSQRVDDGLYKIYGEDDFCTLKELYDYWLNNIFNFK